VLEFAAAENIPIKLAALTINDLLEADEAFLTNSIMGVMPVCRIERRAVGEDKPGPLTRRLFDGYDALVEREG
jgi:branched-subunit amino acid aminotransferase/4-amino-4-deoxychorismate lyase